jgi:hypothetical protein
MNKPITEKVKPTTSEVSKKLFSKLKSFDGRKLDSDRTLDKNATDYDLY